MPADFAQEAVTEARRIILQACTCGAGDNPHRADCDAGYALRVLASLVEEREALTDALCGLGSYVDFSEPITDSEAKALGISDPSGLRATWAQAHETLERVRDSGRVT